MMNNDVGATGVPTAGHLDNRLIVAVLYLSSLVILSYGLITSPVPYTDPSFASHYLSTELTVAVLFLLATGFFFDRRRIGLRAPELVEPKKAVPLAIVLLASFLSWLYNVLTLPADVPYTFAPALDTLKTTLTVGFTEEWMYRGLLFAFFSRMFGLRTGAIIALVLFGALHLLNMFGGTTPGMAAFQFLNTILLGSTFLLAAIGTRSLLFPMLAHGLYDFSVIDTMRFMHAGTGTPGPLIVAGVNLVVAGYCLWVVFSLRGTEPFPVPERH